MGQVDVALRDRVDETLAGQARRQILLLRLTAHGDEERPCSDLRDVHERRVPRATDDHPRRAEEAVAGGVTEAPRTDAVEDRHRCPL